MTKKRIDSHSTEFGLWLREQPEIDSALGYIATNIDFMWRNYKSKLWMLIEEKRYMSQVKKWQMQMFKLIDMFCSADKNYRGFHVLTFENSSPDDGKIYLDGAGITKRELLDFLRFTKGAEDETE